MSELTFVYRGQIHTLHPVVDSRGQVAGYRLDCPGCGRRGVIGIPDAFGQRHTITVDAQGRPTITPSMVCGCGWHVVVRDGVARDA